MYTCYNINKYVHVYTNQRVNTFMLFFLYGFLQQLEFIVDQSQFTCLNL